MPARDALERSQRKLYLDLQAELALFEKHHPPALRAYERAFRASLPKRARATGKTELLRALRAARVVLVGDFHPFRQSQKGFLRLLEETASAAPVVALECFSRSAQHALDEYLANLLTAEELREKIDFERHWPFAWESYREILAHAKRHRFPVLALNLADPDLHARDQAAARAITHHLARHPQSTVFTLYGELHLARPHLPAALRAQLGARTPIAVVHQNDAALYWKAPRTANGQRPEVLRLGPREFCLLNSVPWVKLRSYLDWLEGSEDLEDGPDLPGLVHQYALLLAEALSLPARVTENMEVAGPGVAKKPRGKLTERPLALHARTFQRTAYLPATAAVLLSSPSTNSLSEAASYWLGHSLSAPPVPTTAPARVAQFFLGYFGSKVLNPKRKCNEVSDLEKILTHRRAAAAKAAVARRALSLLRPYLSGEGIRLRTGALRGPGEVEACRLAGYVLAERFFSALVKDAKLLPLAQAWLQTRRREKLLAQTARAVRRAAVAPVSKRDRF